jgi:radical SAM protein with 4Fe4S-binding SPASM domain
LDVLDKPSPDELSTAEAKVMINELASAGKPVLIFSGGEPLVRPDLFDLAAHARGLGLSIALATNGTLIDPAMAKRLKDSGIYYASISLDGTRPVTHDFFRGPGAFEKTLQGFRYLREAGIKVQINFTVTRSNVDEVPEMYELARTQKAIALYLFLLVPVGCGVEIVESQMLSSERVEEWLRWVCEKDRQGPLPIKAICAPHYYRVEQQVAERPGDGGPDRKGCLAGLHMCFISHKGDVFPCGYLPLSAGNVRQQSFREIWQNSPLFQQLRSPDLLTGRCGACEYKVVCGGCRARGYFAQNDVLAEEPYCVYTPPRLDPVPAAG